MHGQQSCPIEELEARGLLQVVPGTLWELLDAMVVLRTQRMAALGTRVEATALKEAAQLAPRAALATYSARIAAFAHGIFTIDKCAKQLSVSRYTMP